MPPATVSQSDSMEAGSESSLYSAWKPAEEIAFWKACIKYGGKSGYTNKSSPQIIKAMTQVHSKSPSTYASKWYRMRNEKAMCETLFGMLRGGYWDRKNHQMRARDPRAEMNFIQRNREYGKFFKRTWEWLSDALPTSVHTDETQPGNPDHHSDEESHAAFSSPPLPTRRRKPSAKLVDRTASSSRVSLSASVDSLKPSGLPDFDEMEAGRPPSRSSSKTPSPPQDRSRQFFDAVPYPANLIFMDDESRQNKGKGKEVRAVEPARNPRKRFWRPSPSAAPTSNRTQTSETIQTPFRSLSPAHHPSSDPDVLDALERLKMLPSANPARFGLVDESSTRPAESSADGHAAFAPEQPRFAMVQSDTGTASNEGSPCVQSRPTKRIKIEEILEREGLVEIAGPPKESYLDALESSKLSDEVLDLLLQHFEADAESRARYETDFVNKPRLRQIRLTQLARELWEKSKGTSYKEIDAELFKK